jgi:hypothetical protein
VRERLCFGLRARDLDGARAALKQVRGGVPLLVQDAARAGLWVRGDGDGVAVARRWAEVLGAPVRLYRVRCLSERGGVRIHASGATLHPDGSESPITSATEDDWDADGGDLDARAESWLSIALEVHEGLDAWDSAIERWG